MKPSDFAVGSVESRVAARARLSRAEPEEVLRVRVIHIGYDEETPLPLLRLLKWNGGLTEITHVAGGKL
jgi:hypothetical protein